MTGTETALLRDVREEPDADEHRLVYADWLDENGHGERAEFIRDGIRLANDPSYEAEPTPREYLQEWFPDCFATPTVEYIVRRGFPDAVTLTTAQFMGGPCGACNGHGLTDREYHGVVESEGGCHACKATGQTPGLARELFELWPITGVRLSDRAPFGSDRLHSSHGYGIGWQKKSVTDRYRPAENATYGITDSLFEFIPGLEHENGAKYFELVESALSALSDAACLYGRGLAGLRELPRRETERIVVDMTGRQHVVSTAHETMRVPGVLHDWRQEPTGGRTVTLTGDVRPFQGHVGKEVYLRIPGETSGPWLVLETEFFSPRFDEGRAVIQNTVNTRTEVTP